MKKEPIRILLVEDDKRDYALTRDMLAEAKGLRFDLEWKTNYDDALKAIEQAKHNVYIIDYRLGQLDGLELVRNAVSMGCKAPIIMLTGEGTYEIDVAAMDAGATEYLTKGQLNSELLERAIRYAIDRKEHEHQIWRQANFDTLTKLPNRSMFLDRLSRALDRGRRDKKSAALFFIDLDRFKWVNDTLGHAAGDQVLQKASERLLACVRKTDTIARLGGDEFVTILTDIDNPKDVERVAQKMLNNLSKPFIVTGEHKVLLSGSIGIATFPDDGVDVETLINNADTAMYRSKEGGRNAFNFFTTEMNNNSIKRVSLERDLRQALDNRELQLYYQPIIDISSGQLLCAEALLRWKNPDRGMLLPKEFLPLAEETGLILPIGEWVLYNAAAQIIEWHEANLQEVGLLLSLNLSNRQFKYHHFEEKLLKTLQNTGLPTNTLWLEISESLTLNSENGAGEILERLKRRGVSLVLDDFGTGYSSLINLNRFSVDVVKIDESFIQGMISDPNNAKLVRAIIAMSHGLDVKVVAEGIETLEQFEFLREAGCDMGQGYHFTKPLPGKEFEEFVRNKMITKSS